MPELKNDKNFTPEELARIAAAVKEHNEKVRKEQIDAEIRNRILDAERKQPGKTGF